MAGYTKEFLVSAYLSRFWSVSEPEELEVLERNANSFYDRVGRDTFRMYASLDAEALREYRKIVE